MTIYIVILLIILLLSFVEHFNSNATFLKKGYLIIFFVIFIVMALRDYSVGTDIKNYIEGYNYIGIHADTIGLTYKNYEPGYVLICLILNKLNFSPSMFIIVISIIVLLPLFYLFKYNSDKPITATFFYITLGLYFFAFSGLRQAIAISICVFSYKYIKQKKLMKFILLVFFASFIHYSALCFICAYPLYYLKLKKRDYLVIGIFSLFIYMLKNQIGDLIYRLIKGENYTVFVVDVGIQWFMIVMLCIFLAIFFLVYHKKKYNEYSCYINYYVLFLLIQIMSSFSNTFNRLGYYFIPFICVLFSNIYSEIENTKIRNLIYFTSMCCFFVFCFYDASVSSLGVIPYLFRGLN